MSYFDAWAHEGDPLRRTFLEQLIDQLIEKKWVLKENWEQEKLKLTGKKSDSEVDVSPILTKLGKWILISSIILLPMGLALFNKGVDIGLVFGYGLPINWYFLIGALMMLVPFKLIWLSNVANKNKWECWIKYFELGKSKDPWAIFVQKYSTKTTTFTTQSPNPTSVEFENCFKSLLRDALKNPNQIVVLVLDNLDRIMPQEALSILSTLQTFLQCNGHVDNHNDRLWVIIPYDPNGLGKLWEEKGSVAISMIDKRFQIRFQVPPLALSNWKDYFITLLGKAFPQHDPSDFYLCYRVYYQTMVKGNFAPTPRDMKLFVNQVGAIHRQWDPDIIPLFHIAYFVYIRRINNDLKVIAQKLVKGEFPEENVKSFLGEKIRDNLAVMLFNVPVDIARQLLLAQPIQEALENNDTGRLIEIWNSGSTGFWAVFESLVADNLTDVNPSGLTNAALCLEESNLLMQANEDTRNLIIEKLQNALARVSVWPMMDASIGKGISSALKMNPDKVLANNIFASLSHIQIENKAKLGGATFEEIASLENQISKTLEGIIVVLRCLEEHIYSGKNFPGQISIFSDGFEYIELCSALYKVDPNKHFWDVFLTAETSNGIIQYLVELVDNDLFSSRHNGTLKVMHHNKLEIDWSVIFSHIESHISQQNISPLHEYLEALWILRGYEPSMESRFPNLLQTRGSIQNHLYEADQRQDFLGVAWAVFIIVRMRHSNTTPSTPSNLYY